MNNVLENTLSSVQSLQVYFIFSHSGSALSFVCKVTWPDIRQCIIDQMDLEETALTGLIKLKGGEEGNKRKLFFSLLPKIYK